VLLLELLHPEKSQPVRCAAAAGTGHNRVPSNHATSRREHASRRSSQENADLVGAERLDQRFQLRDALRGGLHLFPPLLTVPPLRLPIPVLQPAGNNGSETLNRGYARAATSALSVVTLKQAMGVICRKPEANLFVACDSLRSCKTSSHRSISWRANGTDGTCLVLDPCRGKSALVELSGGLRFFAVLRVGTLQIHGDNVTGERE